MGRRYGSGLEGRMWQLHLNTVVCVGEEQLNLGYLFITATGGCYML